MLTSVYYYNHYKPYILKNENRNNIYTKSKSTLALYEENKGKTFILNKSDKYETIEYAKEVSINVVGFREKAKDINNSAQKLKRNINKNNYEFQKGTLSDELEKFISSYNNSLEFTNFQDSSDKLNNFSRNMTKNALDVVGENSKASIIAFSNNKLALNNEHLEKANLEKTYDLINKVELLSKNVINETDNILSYPLSNHMNFRDLGYYYNYKLGLVSDDSFKIIQSGMLIDIAL